MMKDFDLRITMAAASAILLAGCDAHEPPKPWIAQQDTAVCVDQQGNRVADDQCARPVHHSSGISPFLWYYLGRSSALPYYGERVSGGSFTRTAGATYFHAPVSTAMTRSAAIARGGFGSSARSFHSHGG